MFNLKVALSVVSNSVINPIINNIGSNKVYFNPISAKIYRQLMTFSEAILIAKTLGKRLQLINDELNRTDKIAYINGLNRLKDGLLNKFSKEDLNTIFQKGNSKLPFYKYGTLPYVNCNGKGDCANYCYSTTGWRHYSPFIRQLINTIIEREHFNLIENALTKLLTPNNRRKQVDNFRLFVDGDFSSIQLYRQWMGLISRFPNTQFYGYSKSLNYFHQEPNIVPNNYKLNISNGSIYDNDHQMIDDLLAMPFCRGRFDAILATNKRDALLKLKIKYPNNKVLICPDKCGSCTNKGHACGLDIFKDYVIGIIVH